MGDKITYWDKVWTIKTKVANLPRSFPWQRFESVTTFLFKLEWEKGATNSKKRCSIRSSHQAECCRNKINVNFEDYYDNEQGYKLMDEKKSQDNY